MIRALVSIGTNSTRLIALDGDRRIAAESRGTRLGAGIGVTGTIDPAARDRTLAAIDDYVARARTLGVAAIDAIATSALRRATNGEIFAAEVAARVGITPRVLGGSEEATYSYLGATAARIGDGPDDGDHDIDGNDDHHADDDDTGAEEIAVLDVGGGSAELAIDAPARARETGTVRRTLSLEIGAVRLSERHPALLGARALNDDERRTLEEEARADAAAVLGPFGAMRGFRELIAVGGTVFTAAAMIAGGLRDGATMTAADRDHLISELLRRDLEARKEMPHIRPQRADILPAGLIVVDEACRILGVDHFTVSEADLLLGYLTAPAFRAVPFGPRR